jgi:hypothetical protein
MKDTKNSARPQGISDLNILWAIRDIPRSILNSTRKGILCMFVAIIGNNESCKYSQKELEDKLGSSERTIQDQVIYLEDAGFLTIIRPLSYIAGERNEYFLNYKFIIDTAKKNNFV